VIERVIEEHRKRVIESMNESDRKSIEKVIERDTMNFRKRMERVRERAIEREHRKRA
jgi:hypothetical protein